MRRVQTRATCSHDIVDSCLVCNLSTNLMMSRSNLSKRVRKIPRAIYIRKLALPGFGQGSVNKAVAMERCIDLISEKCRRKMWETTPATDEQASTRFFAHPRKRVKQVSARISKSSEEEVMTERSSLISSGRTSVTMAVCSSTERELNDTMSEMALRSR